MRPPGDIDADQLRAAHADAWEELGRQRAGSGGGFIRLPGVRLMASGLAHPQWNSGDVVDPDAVDLDAVRQWYAVLGVPWGLLVPAGTPWRHGRKLFRKRLMGLRPERFTPAPAVPGPWQAAAAGPGDVDAVLDVDAAAFGSRDEVERPWMEPLLSQPAVTVQLIRAPDGRAVATGYSVLTDGEAGPALYVAGIGVLPGWRGRGLGAGVSSMLVEHGLAAGAQLVHLHPDTDAAARIYARLGFVELGGLDIYVDVG